MNLRWKRWPRCEAKKLGNFPAVYIEPTIILSCTSCSCSQLTAGRVATSCLLKILTDLYTAINVEIINRIIKKGTSNFYNNHWEVQISVILLIEQSKVAASALSLSCLRFLQSLQAVENYSSKYTYCIVFLIVATIVEFHT